MVYMLLGTGFEETEAIAPLDLLRRAGVDIKTVGINGKIIHGGHGIGIEADITLDEAEVSDLEMVILPGGLGGVASVRASEDAMNALAFAKENGIDGTALENAVKAPFNEFMLPAAGETTLYVNLYEICVQWNVTTPSIGFVYETMSNG